MAAKRAWRRTDAAPTTLRISVCRDAWLLALAASDRSPHTRRHYRNSVTSFANHAGDPPLGVVTPDQIRAWMIAERAAGGAESSIGTKYAGLRAFLTWAVAEELIPDSPARTVARPKLPDSVPEGFTSEEVRRLIETCDTRTLAGARDAAIMLVLYATALRAAELLSLTRAAVVSEGSRTLITILGKGRKERLITLDPITRMAVERYLLRRGADEEPGLWIGQRGRLREGGLRMLLDVAGKRAGVAHVHPHRFRRTGLAAMLDSGMDSLDVMRIAGHSDLGMLRQYVEYAAQRRANTALLQAAHVQKLGLRGRAPKRS